MAFQGCYRGGVARGEPTSAPTRSSISCISGVRRPTAKKALSKLGDVAYDSIGAAINYQVSSNEAPFGGKIWLIL